MTKTIIYVHKYTHIHFIFKHTYAHIYIHTYHRIIIMNLLNK